MHNVTVRTMSAPVWVATDLASTSKFIGVFDHGGRAAGKKARGSSWVEGLLEFEGLPEFESLLEFVPNSYADVQSPMELMWYDISPGKAISMMNTQSGIAVRLGSLFKFADVMRTYVGLGLPFLWYILHTNDTNDTYWYYWYLMIHIDTYLMILMIPIDSIH